MLRMPNHSNAEEGMLELSEDIRAQAVKIVKDLPSFNAMVRCPCCLHTILEQDLCHVHHWAASYLDATWDALHPWLGHPA